MEDGEGGKWAGSQNQSESVGVSGGGLDGGGDCAYKREIERVCVRVRVPFVC